jgi:Histidine kinase-, DNA gyrase B-, and HSP90-like ATPase
VDWIVNEGDRASDVIRRVRSLANKTDLEKVPLDINDVLKEAIALVEREMDGHQVLSRMELAPALPMILGDRVQLQQVIINLVMNGVEAMQSVWDLPRELVIGSRQDETHQILVTVTDSGVGISAEDADRLFTLFLPRNQVAWVWDCRFAVRSSKLTGDGCRSPTMWGRVRGFSSRCHSIKRVRRDRRLIARRSRKRSRTDRLRHRRRCSDAHDSQQSPSIGGLAGRTVRFGPGVCAD